MNAVVIDGHRAPAFMIQPSLGGRWNRHSIISRFSLGVVGAPDPDMGEQVVAVIQPLDMSQADEALRQELTAYCRANLSHVKTPRRVDFMTELPRHPTGKLYKRLIRDAYWGKEGSRIV